MEVTISKVANTRSISSSIRQKGESSDGCYKKTKRQIFRKSNIFYPQIRTLMINHV